MSKTSCANLLAVAATKWHALATTLLLLCVLLPAHAQRANFEAIVNDGQGFARSWVDVNNDGKDDYCVLAGGGADSLECYLSTGSGFSPMPAIQLGNWDKLRYWWIDVNGDGLVDLCRVMDTLIGGTVRVECRFGPTFTTATSTTLPASDSGGEPGVYDLRDLHFTDVNQDGTNDLCFMYRDSGGTYDLRCVSFLVATFDSEPSSPGRVLSIGDREWARGFHDVNGDGYPDYCGVSGGYIRCALNSKTGFATGANHDVNIAAVNNNRNGSTFVDINGDGNTDFCRITGTSAVDYRLSCRLSTGNGWDTVDRSTVDVIQVGDSDNRWWTDINGDGLPDFCRAVGADPDEGTKHSSLWCRLARGGDSVTGLFGVSDVVFDANVANAIHFGLDDGGRSFCDPYGTGIPTLCRATFRQDPAGADVCGYGESGEWCYPAPVTGAKGIGVGVYGGFVGAVSTPDAVHASPPLLAAYTDGLGAETRITYMPLSSHHVYAKSGPGTAFPRLQVVQPRSPVVFETRAWRTGTDTTLTGNARYFYKDLRVDNQAGSRGFRERWFLTEGSNTLEHTTYFQSLGPTVDASSLLNDARELGQVKERRIFAIDPTRVREDVPGWKPPAGGNTRQRKLSATMYQASAVPASMSTVAVSPPTANNPFMLLKRTVNTLGHTSNDQCTADAAHPRLRPVVATHTESWDWNGSTAVPLPSVDTSVKTTYYGNVVCMQETTTDGSQVWSKKTTNVYGQDNVPEWRLGRLTSTKVESTAPTADVQMASTAPTYGTSPNANTTSSSAASILTLTSPVFANTQVGQTSTANATLSNTAAHTVLITTPGATSVTGQGLSFQSTTCGAQLTAGAACTITVRFAPTSVFTTTGTVSIDSGAGVRMAAFGANSLATHTAATLTSAAPNLGTVMWGSAAPTASAAFRNDGNTAMTLTGLSGLSSRFQLTGNTCSNVAPAGSCTMTLSMPTSGTGGSDTSTVTTVGATANASFSVTGTVRSTVSRWSTTSLAFGSVNVVQPSTQNVTLFNEGFQATANWNAALSNLPAGFTANTSACAAVAPGGSCTVPITFTPGAAQTYSGSNIRPATVSYTNNTLSVTGTGVFPPATITFSANPLSFGTSIPKGGFVTRTMTVTNTGTVAATNIGRSITLGAAAGAYEPGYWINGGTCTPGGTLAGGASCTVTILFGASCSSGTRSGTLSFSSNNLSPARTASLAATVTSSGDCNI